MKRLFRMILLMLLIALSAGCGGGSDYSPSNPADNNLPVETRWWLDDGSGFVQFYTNDLDMCEHGYWARYDEPNEIPMSTVVTQVKKVSGNSMFGFGILFCIQDTSSEIHNYYRLLIYTDGYYQLSKMVNDTFSIIPDSNNPVWDLQDYVFCQSLNIGYNANNTIMVVQIEPGSFEIYFNSDKAATFSDNSYTGGMYGFYTAVGLPSEENFPNTPVDVRFKQQIPDPAAAQSSALRSQSIQKGMTWGVESL